MEIEQVRQLQPETLTPEEAQAILPEVLKTFESMYQALQQATQERDTLKAELRRLKGLPPAPPEARKMAREASAKRRDRPTIDRQKRSLGHRKRAKKQHLTVHQVVEIEAPSQCPDCEASDLISWGDTGDDSPIVQEIEIRAVNTKRVMKRVYCPHCRKTFTSDPPPELSGSFGPELRSWTSVLHYDFRMTEPMVHGFLTTAGIRISSGQVSRLLMAQGKALLPEARLIREQGLAQVSYAHSDETSWPIKGEKNYLWVLAHPRFSYFQTSQRRNSDSARDLLTEQGKDHILVSDDAGAYGQRLSNERKQLCWLHELRHYDKLTAFLDSNRQLIDDKLDQAWSFYRNLQAYRQAPSAESKESLEREFDRIFQDKTGFAPLDHRLQLTWAKRNRLLLCLEHPEVPPENNEAERSLRHPVVVRKISGGSRSQQGAQSARAHFTVIQTCRKLGISPVEWIKDLTTGRKSLGSLAALIQTPTSGLSPPLP
jgi:hypothetical protein